MYGFVGSGQLLTLQPRQRTAVWLASPTGAEAQVKMMPKVGTESKATDLTSFNVRVYLGFCAQAGGRCVSGR